MQAASQRTPRLSGGAGAGHSAEGAPGPAPQPQSRRTRGPDVTARVPVYTSVNGRQRSLCQEIAGRTERGPQGGERSDARCHPGCGDEFAVHGYCYSRPISASGARDSGKRRPRGGAGSGLVPPGPGAWVPLVPSYPSWLIQTVFLAFHNFWLQEFPTTPQKAPEGYFLRPDFYAEFK